MPDADIEAHVAAYSRRVNAWAYASLLRIEAVIVDALTGRDGATLH